MLGPPKSSILLPELNYSLGDGFADVRNFFQLLCGSSVDIDRAIGHRDIGYRRNEFASGSGAARENDPERYDR